MNRALLIGGPVDGEWIDLEDPSDHQVVVIEVTYPKEIEDGEAFQLPSQPDPGPGTDLAYRPGRRGRVRRSHFPRSPMLPPHLQSKVQE